MENDALFSKMFDEMFDEESAKAELAKSSYKDFDLNSENDAPENVIKTFKTITKMLKESTAFKDTYSFRYISEYIPFTGAIYRMFVLKDIDLTSISIKQEIATKQIISIYYDSSNALAYMDQPYYEIYDGHDIERFYENEESNLAKKALEILINKY
jgi:hypothetical protein